MLNEIFLEDLYEVNGGSTKVLAAGLGIATATLAIASGVANIVGAKKYRLLVLRQGLLLE